MRFSGNFATYRNLSHMRKAFVVQTLFCLMLLSSIDPGKPTSGGSVGLSIMGTIAQGTDDSKSVALVKEIKSGKVSAVKKDMVIGDQYKVMAIRPKYIVLMTRSAERLLVYQDKFAGEFVAPSGPPSSAPSMAVSEVYREDGFERVPGRVTMTPAYRDKLVKRDLPKILMQATAEPFFVNGVISGFKMSQIEPDSIYAKGGLRDEDVVTSINDIKLTSIAGAVSLLQSLKEADSVDMEILRGGQTIKMTVQVK